MNYLRTAHERAAFERIFYSGSDVYRNKLGIRDASLLEETERALTSVRASQGFPPEATFRTYDGLKAIHRHLFQDLYDWAGEERLYTTGRGPTPFAVPEHIASWMLSQFENLAAENFLEGLNLDEFALRAAHYVNEINAGHPFVDGNGRAQRFWLRMLTDHAGFALTLSETDRVLWNDASRIGFEHADHAPMAQLIADRLN